MAAKKVQKKRVGANAKETVRKTRGPNKRTTGVEAQVNNLASNFAQELLKVIQQGAQPVQVMGGRGRSTTATKGATGVGSQAADSIGKRGGKVAEIKEGLLKGMTDDALVGKGFNLSTIRTIKWALRKEGQLSQ